MIIFITIPIFRKFTSITDSVSFLCLMAYQSLWVIKCERHAFGRIIMEMINTKLQINKLDTFLKSINPKVSVIGQLGFKFGCKQLHYKNSPAPFIPRQ